MKKFKFEMWRPAYATVKVEASTYEEALKLAKEQADEMPSSAFRVDSDETTVLPENLETP